MTEKARTKTLYLCYFGLREPLVQTQVLPYLRELARGGVGVVLLTFEPHFKRTWSSQESGNWKQRLLEDGIHWEAIAYHKRPTVPATFYDVAAGVWRAFRLMKRHVVNVVHARSHIPALMGLVLKRLTGCRLVFDFRGLLAEEYQDAGIWTPDSLPFLIIKWIEKVSLRNADRVIALTEGASDWMVEQGVERRRIRVIPCCVDLSRFAGSSDKVSGHTLRERMTVVYAGSVVGLYMLSDMLRFVETLRHVCPETHFLVLTAADPEIIYSAAQLVGFPAEALTVLLVSPSEVPVYLRLARIGLSFRKPTFSQIAASPTKIPEYLAAGIPVVSNAGIGDTDDIVRRERVGLVLEELNDGSFKRAAKELLELVDQGEALAERCRATSRRYFSLEEVGGPRYREVYNSL